MNHFPQNRSVRRLALTLVALALLALGLNGAASAAPASQTLPTFTPTQVNAPEPSATSTQTPTPRRQRNPTATATATASVTTTPTASPTANAAEATATSVAGATATAGANATATAGANATATARAGGPTERPEPTEVRDDERCPLRPDGPPAGSPRGIRQPVDGNSALVIVNCPWSIEIEAGDLGAPGTIEAKLINPGDSRGPNSGERFFGPHVELTLFDSNGNPIAAPTFKQPVQLCFSYTSADLAIIGDPASFAVELFDPGKKQWERLPSTVDRTHNRVCTLLPHLSLYALAARVPQPSSLPNTSAESGPAVGTWVWVLLALALGTGASIRAHGLRRELTEARQPVRKD
ncbi:hypothetical protein [Kouleothrix sp.]|uniref:hypothetical protein n=1 Tax=Kouleothrix sp. TaxID=2779161 RepID=UPI0039189115